jgi:hypothetical protein
VRRSTTQLVWMVIFRIEQSVWSMLCLEFHPWMGEASSILVYDPAHVWRSDLRTVRDERLISR